MEYTKLWANRSYSPFVMNVVVRSTVCGFIKIFPESCIKSGGVFWQNKKNTYFYPQKEFFKTVDLLSIYVLEHNNWVKKIFDKILKEMIDLRLFSEQCLEKDIKEQSVEELANLIYQFEQKFCEAYSYGTISIILGYTEDNPIYHKARKILENKLNDKHKISDFYLSLTKPPVKLAIQNYELEILKLSQKAKKMNLIKKEDILFSLQEDFIKLHNNFGWLSFDICDNLVWDFDYYATEVLNKFSINIDQRIDELNSYEINTKDIVDKIKTELKLNFEEYECFELIRNIGYYKWLREYEFLKAIYNIKSLQDEFGLRLGLSTLETKYLLGDEFLIVKDNLSSFKNKLQDRMKNFLVIYEKEKCNILSGTVAEEEINNLKFDDEVNNKKEVILRGNPAFLGRVVGKVRIVDNLEDIKKMTLGDVLVSQATSPDLMPAIKKAIALVTNEGGVACHASIVSRELKIPCIVGTKIATKVFKDGDLVEVDATHGIIRLIESS